MTSKDLLRLQEEYADRRLRFANKDIYCPLNISTLYSIHQRQRKTQHIFQKHGIKSLSNSSILEIGCGNGGTVKEYISWGAVPFHTFGVDIIFNRLHEARCSLPTLPFVCANGENLPFPGGMFDIVLQYTAFSSILDTRVKQHVAKEILRVTKPSGIILWYDFWTNPTNKQTAGISPSEIRELFLNCNFEFYKITLAPPIARLIVPFSWMFASCLENLRFLNSHYLVLIKPT